MSLLFRFSYRRNRTLTLENGLIASLSASCTSESRTLSKRAPGQLHASSNFCTTAVNVNSKVVIYGFPLSQPTRSVLMLCEEENIPYEVIIVDALKGENRKPAFKRMHPAGLVPVINDNGTDLGCH